MMNPLLEQLQAVLRALPFWLEREEARGDPERAPFVKDMPQIQLQVALYLSELQETRGEYPGRSGPQKMMAGFAATRGS
eukprot:11197866-Lingulodinium_polyedra.AAC.1